MISYKFRSNVEILIDRRVSHNDGRKKKTNSCLRSTKELCIYKEKEYWVSN